MARRETDVVNKVILVGNLGKDPEMTYTPSGVAVTKVSLATNKKWTTQSGEKREQTTWHNLVFWRKQAEIANEFLRKGSKLYVEGEIQNRSWDKPDGSKGFATDIQVNEFKMLDSRGDSGGGYGGGQQGGGQAQGGGGGGRPQGGARQRRQQPQQDGPYYDYEETGGGGGGQQGGGGFGGGPQNPPDDNFGKSNDPDMPF